MAKLIGVVLIVLGLLWLIYVIDYNDNSHFKWYTIVRDFSVGSILIGMGVLLLIDKIEF